MRYTYIVKETAKSIGCAENNTRKGMVKSMEERLIGTVSRGVRAPIIRQGDDIAAIVVDSVVAAADPQRR